MLAYLANPSDDPVLSVQDAIAESDPDVVLFLDFQDFSRSENGSSHSAVAQAVMWIRTAHNAMNAQTLETFRRRTGAHESQIMPCIAMLDLPAPGMTLSEAELIAEAGGVLVERPEGYDQAWDKKLVILDQWVRHLERDLFGEFGRGWWNEEPGLPPIRGQDDQAPDEAALNVYSNPAYGLPREDCERLVDATRSHGDVPPSRFGTHSERWQTPSYLLTLSRPTRLTSVAWRLRASAIR